MTIARLGGLRPEVRAADKPAPSTTFHCGTCGQASPTAAQHQCNLSRRQLRRIAAGNARQRRSKELERTPRGCPDCQETIVPGVPHTCRISPERMKSRERYAHDTAAALAAAGYDIHYTPAATHEFPLG